MKIKEAIELIKKYHQPFVWNENTRDKLLIGDDNIECSGICTTCCATYEVMQKCVQKGINLIISHEGIFYNYEKNEDIYLCENEVVKRKIEFASENNIVVWRDHDAMHGPFLKEGIREKADLIFYGTMKELGWDKYLVKDEKKPLWYKIPEISAREFADILIDKWNLNGLRIVGNLDSKISNIFICEHVNGGQKDISIIENCRKADAIIPLEICDYTLTTYVRDASYLGMNKVIFEMGHFNGEELGMKYLAKSLLEVFGETIPVEFIQSGDGFNYVVR